MSFLQSASVEQINEMNNGAHSFRVRLSPGSAVAIPDSFMVAECCLEDAEFVTWSLFHAQHKDVLARVSSHVRSMLSAGPALQNDEQAVIAWTSWQTYLENTQPV